MNTSYLTFLHGLKKGVSSALAVLESCGFTVKHYISSLADDSTIHHTITSETDATVYSKIFFIHIYSKACLYKRKPGIKILKG